MSDLPTTKVCSHCSRPRHLTQFHPAKRGPKPAHCVDCTDSLRELRKEVERDKEVLTQISQLYN